MPGLDILRESVMKVVRRQPERKTVLGHLERNEIPEINGHQVDGKKVQLILRIGLASEVPDLTLVAVPLAAGRGLHLYPRKTATMFHSNVVAGRISEGTGHAVPVRRRTGHETQFRPLSTDFAILNLTPDRSCHTPPSMISRNKKGAAVLGRALEYLL